jgi:hypothetical protein
MVRAAFGLLLFVIVAAGEVTAAKEALLIANAEYSHFGKLPNPISDARQLGDVLRQIGFNVQLVENASREGMLDALSSFEERLKASRGIAFFHYGGHGVQVDGRNFLIPADADIPDEKRVATRAVDLEEVMGALDASGSSVNVVVLDACRDNPLPATSTRSATRGLSVVARKPKNSIIVYAAEADNKAMDGLFTPVLARAIASSAEKDISDVMKTVRREVYEVSQGAQTPGEYNQLFTEVVLADGTVPQVPPGALGFAALPRNELQGQSVPVPVIPQSHGSDVDQLAVALVQQLLRTESERDLDTQLHLYKSVVVSGGKPMTKAALRKQTETYYERWPRARWELLEAPKLLRQVAPDRYEVGYRASYRVESPVRRKWSQGILDSVLTVDLVDGSLVISSVQDQTSSTSKGDL